MSTARCNLSTTRVLSVIRPRWVLPAAIAAGVVLLLGPAVVAAPRGSDDAAWDRPMSIEPAPQVARAVDRTPGGSDAQDLSGRMDPTDSGYGPEYFNDTIGDMALNAPWVLNLNGPIGDAHYSGADFGNDGNFSFMYALDGDSNAFVTIHIASGAVTTIGPAVPYGSESWTGMAMDSTTGTMYASSTDCAGGESLYTIDLSTGTPTRIGAFTNTSCTIAIAVGPFGQLYGLDLADNLVAIDKSNCAGSVIGPLGYNANYSQGMDFDESDGTLYLAAYNCDNDPCFAELRIADTGTGMTYPVGGIGNVSPGGGIGMSAFGVATRGPTFKWFQPPVEYDLGDFYYGWDEFSVWRWEVVADDWACESSDPVTHVKWWGSYLNWTEPEQPPVEPDFWLILIWTDVPAGVDQTFSHPGTVIHEIIVPDANVQREFVGKDFYDGAIEATFQYNYTFDPSEYFFQEDVSDCCSVHPAPGCDDQACEEVVCSYDSYCCEYEWEEWCSAWASVLCPECYGGGSDCCTPHSAPGCDDPVCEAAVCYNDPHCCDVEWVEWCAFDAYWTCDVCDVGAPAPNIYWITIAAGYWMGIPEYPWGWTTRLRDTTSLAPDDAVIIWDPWAPVLGSTYVDGWPIETTEGSWDMAFELYTNPDPPDEDVKWSQPPKPVPQPFYNGWDEPSGCPEWSPYVADDWYCDSDAPIEDIHWWGSFVGWTEPYPPYMPDLFHFFIWTDVPAGVDETFSHPGSVIHEMWSYDFTWEFVGWDIDPRDPTAPPEATFRFDATFPEWMWFYQEPGTSSIYWLSIAACYGGGPPPSSYPWGWKTRPRDPDSLAPDDAVRIPNPFMFYPWPGITWEDIGGGSPIEYPAGESWDMAFALTTSSEVVVPPDAPTPPPGEAGYEKIRYISMDAGNPGTPTALEVTLTNVSGFPSCNGLKLWVSAPVTKCENAGQGDPPVGGCGPAPGLPLTMQSANLQTTPLYMDWSTVGTVHVTDDAIVPSSTYDVRAFDGISLSMPLTITTSKWGDLISDCTSIPCGPPDGIVNVTTDVTAVLDKYKNLPGAVMKSRADLDWNVPDWLINISDVTFCLDAFLGFTYPPTGWAGPGGCP